MYFNFLDFEASSTVWVSNPGTHYSKYPFFINLRYARNNNHQSGTRRET